MRITDFIKDSHLCIQISTAVLLMGITYSFTKKKMKEK